MDMKEKEIREIVRALEQISLGVDTIKTVLKRSLNNEADVVNTFFSADKFSEKKSPSVNKESSLLNSESSSSDSAASSPNTSGGLSSSSDGFLDVLDLSGDIKKVQLALMRMGKGTANDVAKIVSLDVDEVRIYLKTLMRDSAILALSSGDSETVYRTVLKKKGKKPSKGAASLLDKLL